MPNSPREAAISWRLPTTGMGILRYALIRFLPRITLTNRQQAAEAAGASCGIGAIEYADQVDTALEFVKPIGTGTNLWPNTPTAYPYTTTCIYQDTLKAWFAVADNLNTFAHISHTFTHEDENNATYFDV